MHITIQMSSPWGLFLEIVSFIKQNSKTAAQPDFQSYATEHVQ